MTVWLHPDSPLLSHCDMWNMSALQTDSFQDDVWFLDEPFELLSAKRMKFISCTHFFFLFLFFRKNFKIQVFHFVIPLQTTCWFLHETSLNLISCQRTAVIKRAWCVCAPFVYVLKCCFNSGCYWQEDLQPWRRLWMTHGVGGVTPHPPLFMCCKKIILSFTALLRLLFSFMCYQLISWSCINILYFQRSLACFRWFFPTKSVTAWLMIINSSNIHTAES